MNSTKQIFSLITKLSEERQISFSELGRRTNVSRSTLSRYKNGSRDFQMNKIEEFARVLNVSPEYLLGFSDIVKLKKENQRLKDKMNNIKKMIEEGV